MTTPANNEHPILWIKNDIDEILARVRQSIETFGNSDNLSQTSALVNTVDDLHQLEGALQILNYYGLALLVEDVQCAVRDLLSDRIKRPEDLFEAIVHALLATESYIERLYNKLPDVPAALIPIINDLRAAREQPLVSESALFSPDLSIVPQSDTQLTGHQDDIIESARTLRPYYQAALLSWYQNPEDSLSLKQMRLVIQNLEATALTPRNKQLWWIAGGLLEALNENGLSSNISLRLLLGQLDRIIKMLSTRGAPEIEDTPPVELLKNLLFYVAQATSLGERVRALQSIYKLDHQDSELDISEAENALRRPRTSTLASIADEVRSNLEKTKTDIENYARNPSATSSIPASIINTLKHIMDTLSIIGLGGLNMQLKSQMNSLQQLIDNGHEPNNEELLAIAENLLTLEYGLQELTDPALHSQFDPDSTSGEEIDMAASNKISRLELQHILQAAIIEARKNLEEVKKLILVYLSRPANPDKLKKSIGLLNEFTGCMTILNEIECAELTQFIREYIDTQLINGDPPDREQLDALAESIVSIEYYLEAIVSDTGKPDQMLQLSASNLKQLGYTSSTVTAAQNSESNAKVTHLQAIPRKRTEVATPVTASDIASQHNEEDKAEAEEVRLIFSEEAEGELSKIQQTISDLQLAGHDNRLYQNLQKFCHTLKGSGRIAGATQISSLADRIDHYITRIDSDSTDLQPLSLLKDSSQVLAQLIQDYRNGTQARDISPIVARLDSHPASQPEGAPERQQDERSEAHQAVATDKSSEATQDIATPYASQTPEQYLQQITHTLNRAQAEPGRHTLDTATIEAIAALANNFTEIQRGSFADTAQLLYSYAHTLQSTNQPLGNEELDILTDFCETALDILQAPESSSDETTESQHTATSTGATDTEYPVNNLEEATQDDTHVETMHQTTDISASEIDGKPIEDIVAGAEATDSSATVLSQIDSTPASEFQDDDDFDLLDIFLEEAGELCDSAYTLTGEWANNKDPQESARSMLRVLHTLKGSARMAGVTAVANLAHSLESYIEAKIQQNTTDDMAVLALTQEGVDYISDMIDAIKTGKDIEFPVDFLVTLEKTQDSIADSTIAEDADTLPVATRDHTSDTLNETARTDDSDQSATSNGVDAEKLPAQTDNSEDGTAQAVEQTYPHDESQEVETEEYPDFDEDAIDLVTDNRPLDRSMESNKVDSLKIESDTLDSIIDMIEEQGVLQGHIDESSRAIKTTLSEVEKALARVHTQLRDIEFESQAKGNTPTADDELGLENFSRSQEAAKRLIESVDDIQTLNANLNRLSLNNTDAAQRSSRLNRDLHETLVKLRMVSFSNQQQRLNKILRQTCKLLNKQATLELDGTEGAIDKNLLTQLVGPIEHIIRNAIAHGIESPEQREAAGKPATGKVKLTLEKDGNDQIIKISDDGRGIQLDRVRQRAIELGVIDPDQELGKSEALNLIMTSGFSTSQDVDQVSGRGIGMDVVYNEINKQGGSLFIETDEGQGTTFIIKVPFTLAIKQTLVVGCGANKYAIPSEHIVETITLSGKELQSYFSGENPVFTRHQQDWPIRYLEAIFHEKNAQIPEASEMAHLLLIKHQEKTLALIVDSILESRDSVLKPTGAQLNTADGIQGATILPDGKVVLILDTPKLIEIASRYQAHYSKFAIRGLAPDSNPHPDVLIVDDSITVRKVTTRLLERHQATVRSAKDGIDALEKVAQHRPDIILLDIEMPRMDGLEFCRRIRDDEDTREIPIVMITSRSGSRQQSAALELGVNRFMSKPYQEGELLEAIESLTDKPISQAQG